MSSRKLIALAALLLTTAALGSCGFQPVYADRAYRLSAPASGSQDVTADLANVRLLPLRDRAGQKLQNLLIDRMYPHGYPAKPAYTLDLSLTTTENELGIQKDATATRAELLTVAKLTLHKSSDNSTAYRTTIRTRVAYSILDAQYATLVARENATDRALGQVADEVVTRLSLFFSRDPAITDAHTLAPPEADDAPDAAATLVPGGSMGGVLPQPTTIIATSPQPGLPASKLPQ